jgi:1-aminocyclopropane-1-carboxylate deaminase
MTLDAHPRTPLLFGPSPIHRLGRLTEHLGGRVELWAKRDDLTGLLETGNKIRKLEFLIGEALAQGADTLVTCGGVQSNHARATAATAARSERGSSASSGTASSRSGFIAFSRSDCSCADKSRGGAA